MPVPSSLPNVKGIEGNGLSNFCKLIVFKSTPSKTLSEFWFLMGNFGLPDWGRKVPGGEGFMVQCMLINQNAVSLRGHAVSSTETI